MRPPGATAAGRQLNDVLIRAQRGRCYLCGGRFNQLVDRLRCSQDHVLPRNHGGRDRRNKLLAHRACNEAKRDRLPRPCELIYLDAIYTMLGMPG